MTGPLSPDGYGLLAVTDIAPDLLAQFKCGNIRLEAFLTEQAAFFHRERLGFCWVVVHRDWPTLVGYFTLNNDAVQLSTSEEGDLGLSDSPDLSRFPAVNIGRLAVATELQGNGVSARVMYLALDEIRGESDLASAARLVVVDADNTPRVLRYYERHGFVVSRWAEKQATHQGGKKPRVTVKMLRDILMPW